MKLSCTVALLFLVSLFVPGHLFAKTTSGSPPDVDSLRRVLQKVQSDTGRLCVLEKISLGYTEINLQQAIQYAKEAHDLALRLQLPESIARLRTILGTQYSGMGNYSTAEYFYLLARQSYSKLSDKKGMAAVHASLSLNYKKKGNAAQALTEAFSALSLYEDLADERGKAVVLENIGTIYLEQKNHGKALEYYNKALAHFEKTDEKLAIARNLANQAIIFNAQGLFDKALRAHVYALKVNTALNRRNAMQINLANIGISHSNLGRLDSALWYHQRALKISEGLGDKGSIAINLGNSGDTYYRMAEREKNKSQQKKRLIDGILYLEKAVDLCDKIGLMGPFEEFSGVLSEAYTLNGEHQKALQVFKRHIKAKDSLYSNDYRSRIAHVEALRELQLKDKELEVKNKELQIRELKVINARNERVIYVFLILLLIGALLLLFRLLRLRMLRHRKTLSEIADIHAHEVRAPLARILGLVSLIDHKGLDKDTSEIFQYIAQSAKELDGVVRKTVKKTTDS